MSCCNPLNLPKKKNIFFSKFTTIFPTGSTRIFLDLLVPVYHNLGSTIIFYFVQKIVFIKLKEIINIGTWTLASVFSFLGWCSSVHIWNVCFQDCKRFEETKWFFLFFCFESCKAVFRASLPWSSRPGPASCCCPCSSTPSSGRNPSLAPNSHSFSIQWSLSTTNRKILLYEID